MMNRTAATAVSTVLAMTAASFAGPSPKDKPATPAAGSYEAYQVDAKAALAEYQKLIPKPIGLADANAASRDAVAPQAIPIMKRLLVSLDKMKTADPSAAQAVEAVRMNQEGMVYALGDAETIAALDAKAKAGGDDGVTATNVVLRGRWYKAGKDVAQQTAVVGAIETAAKTQPKDPFLSQFIADIRPNVEDAGLKAKLLDALTASDNPTARAMVAKSKTMDLMQSYENKPMVLAGKMPDGKDFTTADWKGKVVLVDFWAVWCGPCVAELPRVKKMYEQYHDKGLEVLGVDNDYAAAVVTNYAQKNNLPWPQLFDAEAAGKKQWHALSKEHGVNAIPRMFLIDKKGVCRTVTARADFEELIPKLLAE